MSNGTTFEPLLTPAEREQRIVLLCCNFMRNFADYESEHHWHRVVDDKTRFRGEGRHLTGQDRSVELAILGRLGAEVEYEICHLLETQGVT